MQLQQCESMQKHAKAKYANCARNAHEHSCITKRLHVHAYVAIHSCIHIKEGQNNPEASGQTRDNRFQPASLRHSGVVPVRTTAAPQVYLSTQKLPKWFAS